MTAVAGQPELLQQTKLYDFNSILDVGFGYGEALEFFIQQEKETHGTGYDFDSYDFSPIVEEQTKLYENVNVENMSVFQDASFDAVWCSHVLEHVRNTGKTLDEIHRILTDDGYLFVIVPEDSDEIRGGHINIGWNIGTLMYNLILAGFDVRNGSFIKHKKNIVGFVQKQQPTLPRLRYDKGDVETLSGFFPEGYGTHGFQGNIHNINWQWHEYKPGSIEKIRLVKEQVLTALKNFMMRVFRFIYRL